jgi:hypothetical protein
VLYSKTKRDKKYVQNLREFEGKVSLQLERPGHKLKENVKLDLTRMSESVV